MKKLFILVFLLLAQSTFAATPKVVASIQPIHSLTAAVMEGVGKPHLLLPPTSSPHFYQLKPRDAELIHTADLIVWVGPELENFMEKPFQALNPNGKKLTLIDIEDLMLLESDHSHHDHSAHHHSHSHDPHIWLSPKNAKLIVREIEKSLSELDPKHKDLYRLNAIKALSHIDSTAEKIQNTLSSVSDTPFLVFHDGYLYLNHEFHLNQAGHMTDNPHVPLSLHKIKEIKQIIEEKEVACLFSEPGANRKILEQIANGTNAGIGELDPLGVDLIPGPDAYHKMMLKLANNVQACLEFGFQQEPEEP